MVVLMMLIVLVLLVHGGFEVVVEDQRGLEVDCVLGVAHIFLPIPLETVELLWVFVGALENP